MRRSSAAWQAIGTRYRCGDRPQKYDLVLWVLLRWVMGVELKCLWNSYITIQRQRV